MHAMNLSLRLRCWVLTLALVTPARTAAQSGGPAAPPEPPPAWEMNAGASFVGTGGNTETSSTGAELQYRRNWPVWKLDTGASIVRATDRDRTTAERYIGSVLAQRALSATLSLAAGLKGERDRYSGLNARSTASGGVNWAAVRGPRWTLDTLTSLTMIHEAPTTGPSVNDVGAWLQASSKFILSKTADTTQRLAFYPNFSDTDDHRTEAELALQAAVNSWLAVKLGYLLRYDNQPIVTFRKTDTTMSASLVLKLRP